MALEQAAQVAHGGVHVVQVVVEQGARIKQARIVRQRAQAAIVNGDRFFIALMLAEDLGFHQERIANLLVVVAAARLQLGVAYVFAAADQGIGAWQGAQRG